MLKLKTSPLSIILMLAALLIIGFGNCCFADQEKISDVIVSGNRRIENSAILYVVKSKPGDNFFEDKVDADLKSIYSLGFFSDVKVEKSIGEKGILLNFTVTERPVVREINFDGNKVLSVDKLKDALDIKPNTIYSAKNFAKGIKKILKLYSDEGYSLASVDTEKENISPDNLKVTLKIVEGSKILIREIRFEGNNAFTGSKLRDLLETKQDWWLAWLTGAGVYKEEVLKNDMLLLSEHYMNNGYINFKVAEPKVELTADRKALQATITVTEGDQFRVGQLDMKGDLLENKAELEKNLKLKTGEVFSRAQLRQEIFAFTDLYADKGYAFANVNPLTVINNEKKLVDIMFDFEKGEKVYIDRINIAGNAKTRDKVIRRELRIAEGDLYSATGLKKSKQNIMNLGFFEEAAIVSAKSKTDSNKLNLDVSVKEKQTGTFSIGGGYSSLDGVVGQGSIQQANLLGYGWKANASASIGGKSTTYNLGLTDPHFLDTRWSVGADLYHTERKYVDYNKKASGGDIKAGYQLSDTLNVFTLYKFEKSTISDKSWALQETQRLYPDTVTTNDSTTSMISASISRNTTDFRLDPTSGMTNSLGVDFAGLGGTSHFLRYVAQTAQFFPVGLGTVFMIHGTFGHIQEAGAKLPIDEKFYLGGISTLRGYAGRTVSPYVRIPSYDPVTGVKTGDTNAYLGGDTEVVFNAEYTIPLLKDAGLKGVVFFDSGNSVDGVGNVFSNMLSSYGFGIRWFSPIGPLRLEYGIPLNRRDGIDKNGKLEFSIGSFF